MNLGDTLNYNDPAALMEDMNPSAYNASPVRTADVQEVPEEPGFFGIRLVNLDHKQREMKRPLDERFNALAKEVARRDAAVRAEERARQPQDSPTEQEARERLMEAIYAYRRASDYMGAAEALAIVERALDAYRDAVRGEAEARIAALEAGLSDAVGHMIWMTGGWGLDHKITDEAGPLMRAGIDRARALLAAPDAPRLGGDTGAALKGLFHDAPRICFIGVGGTPGDPGGTLTLCGKPLPCPDHPAPDAGEVTR